MSGKWPAATPAPRSSTPPWRSSAARARTAFRRSALARRVGISKAALFHHFASIEAVPVAAFERMIAASLARPMPQGAGLADIVAALGADTFAMIAHNRDFLRAYFVFAARSLFDEELGGRFRASGDVLMGQLRSVLAPLAREGVDTQALARLVAMMLDGLGVHLVAFNRGPDVEAAFKLFVELISKEGKAP